MSGRDSIEGRLQTAGFVLSNARLTVTVPEPEQLRYPVRNVPELVTGADGVRRMKWNCRRGPRLSPTPGNCLAQFLRLATGPEAKILAFAAAWGPFGKEGPVERSGSLDDWRAVAGRLTALLAVASRLQQDQPAEEDEWVTMLEAYPPLTEMSFTMATPSRLAWNVYHARQSKDENDGDDDDDMGNSDDDNDPALRPPLEIREQARFAARIQEAPVIHQREVVAFFVERWFEYGNIKIRPSWGIGEAPFSALVVPDNSYPVGKVLALYDPDPLAGVLALELAAALASPNGIFRCASCGYPYSPPKRRPRSGVAHYCPQCSEGQGVAAKRAWWRTHRSHKADAATDLTASQADARRARRKLKAAELRVKLVELADDIHQLIDVAQLAETQRNELLASFRDD